MSQDSEDNRFRIRTAESRDITLIIRFIRELAEHVGLGHEVGTDEGSLAESLFGAAPCAEVLIGEHEGMPVGFAVYFFNFSTFLGRPGLYVEDIYVLEEFRGRGLGRAFFRELARIAERRGCGRMEWWVLNSNEAAAEFYWRMGARSLDEGRVFRLREPEIRRLASL